MSNTENMLLWENEIIIQSYTHFKSQSVIFPPAGVETQVSHKSELYSTQQGYFDLYSES